MADRQVNPLIQLRAIALEAQHQLAAAQNRGYDLAIELAHEQNDHREAIVALKQVQEQNLKLQARITELEKPPT